MQNLFIINNNLKIMIQYLRIVVYKEIIKYEEIDLVEKCNNKYSSLFFFLYFIYLN